MAVTLPIYMLAPAAGMTFAATPSGNTYVSDGNAIITITNGSTSDQLALAGSGCVTLQVLFGVTAPTTLGFATLAALYAQDVATPYAKATLASVYQDGTIANNGLWAKTGAGNGGGNWTEMTPFLPSTYDAGWRNIADCYCATAAALPAYTYNNGTGGLNATLTANANGSLTIDGQAFNHSSTARLILVKDETAGNAPYNGIYLLIDGGDGSHPWQLRRAVFFDTSGRISTYPNISVFSTHGTANIGTVWTCTVPGGFVTGTTALSFAQFNTASPFYQTAAAKLALYGFAGFSSLGTLQMHGRVDFLSPASDWAIVVSGPTNVSPNLEQCNGLKIAAGFDNTDSTFHVSNNAETLNGFDIHGDMAITMGGAPANLTPGGGLQGNGPGTMTYYGGDFQTYSDTGNWIANVASNKAFTIKENGVAQIIAGNGGKVNVPNILTTASAANVFVDNAASNNMLRVTSSLAHKADLQFLSAKSARAIIRALRPFTYRSRAKADDPRRRFIGLGAEHVAAVTDSLVQYGPDGKPDGVMYDRVGVLNLVMAQNHDRRLRLMEFGLWALAIALVASWVWRG